jgi:hypothetical protein
MNEGIVILAMDDSFLSISRNFNALKTDKIIRSPFSSNKDTSKASQHIKALARNTD